MWLFYKWTAKLFPQTNCFLSSPALQARPRSMCTTEFAGLPCGQSRGIPRFCMQRQVRACTFRPQTKTRNRARCLPPFFALRPNDRRRRCSGWQELNTKLVLLTRSMLTTKEEISISVCVIQNSIRLRNRPMHTIRWRVCSLAAATQINQRPAFESKRPLACPLSITLDWISRQRRHTH